MHPTSRLPLLLIVVVAAITLAALGGGWAWDEVGWAWDDGAVVSAP